MKVYLQIYTLIIFIVAFMGYREIKDKITFISWIIISLLSLLAVIFTYNI